MDVRATEGLVNEDPEYLPPLNGKLVIAVVVPADVHQPNETAFHGLRDCKYPTLATIQLSNLIVVLPVVDHLPDLAIRRRFHDPRLQGCQQGQL
jgi:hypothetical protein